MSQESGYFFLLTIKDFTNEAKKGNRSFWNIIKRRIFIFKAWIVSEKSDIEIVRDIKNGSVSAFQELYSRYADIVYRNILARVNSSFDADDIFQDFFIQVWEKRDAFQVSSSVKGYLLIWIEKSYIEFNKTRTDSW